MDFLKEFLILFGRVFTILPLMLLATLFMGKRSIGELPIFDFLILLSLGSVVGADIADPKIEHIHTAIAIILIAILQKIVVKGKISNRKFGKLATFEPTVVIKDGKFITENLKDINYSIDNLLMMLREKDVFDLRAVKLGIIEANGKLSVLKTASKSNVVLEDINIFNKQPEFTLPVIIEGKIYEEVLEDFNLDENWVKEQLNSAGIEDMEEVFYAAVDQNHTFHVSLKRENIKIPKITH
ncbi:DUF421 domain-containing protein [Oceanobacillus halophilus]|uniref:DUF421 domain-containing protein n=1 Tax=Oceanobacillus halophilus TaxID=930130 RepID=A0A495A2R1_9BACI|nr:DUF421 domain-containing protein [Oceanobacillus halophilus]RKQ33877.1 DUF421 domain-containing protein [Oceanobacillus halophilus]